ncbi:MAG TPA: hypothetical protein VIV12_25820 [Streptosporangiaceae bacterium]
MKQKVILPGATPPITGQATLADLEQFAVKAAIALSVLDERIGELTNAVHFVLQVLESAGLIVPAEEAEQSGSETPEAPEEESA